MKRLGQHFLKNKSAIKKIIDALDLKSGDTIIEVGAGHGELTEVIRVSGIGYRILAIEKDKRLANLLKEKFGGDRRIKIIEGDALKILKSPPMPHTLNPKPYKLVGNIPYYITGRLLRILSELPKKPEICVLTLQKEVSERIVAKPPRMNRLAAIAQFWAEPKIISVISKEDFEPQPEVDSAIVKLETRKQKIESRSEDLRYYATVRMLFAQPRKTILNNLLSDKRQGTGNKETIVKSLGNLNINPNDRPQNLNIEDIQKISRVEWQKETQSQPQRNFQ